MNLFGNGKIGPKITKLQNRTEDGVVIDAKTQKVKNVEVLSTKNIHQQQQYDSINISIHFL